jgi:uncharacterized protein (TIGR02001 family)
MNAQFHRIAVSLAAPLAALILCGPAFADGMRGKAKAKEPAPVQERCKYSANAALTTDYVFRGISQTSEGPAIQGGFDATCGMFYAGVWASNLDWGGTGLFGYDGNSSVANIEMDWYAGIKGTRGRFSYDLGVIYYSYPNSVGLGLNNVGDVTSRNYNYVEFKLGASAEIWKDATFGATAYYSPDYQYEVGSVWTFEGAFVQNLHKFTWRREYSPSFSALIGYQTSSGNLGDRELYALNVTGDTNNYFYWNAGFTIGFLEKWSVDVRYWDTNIDRPGVGCGASLFACDERWVGTLKFTY